MSTLAHHLLAHYRQHPERVAVHLQRNRQPDLPITYRRLVEGAAGIAKQLAAASVRADEVVAIILPHGEPLIYAFWGATLYGAIPSVLSPLTEKLLPERYRKDLAALLRVTRPTAIVTWSGFADEARQAIRSAEREVQLILADAPFFEAPHAELTAGALREPSALALLQHSSGTTGLQKGVALSHQAIFNQLDAYAPAIGLSESDCIVSWLPLYHDMGLIACFIMPLMCGVPLVLMSPFDWVRAPAKLLQAITTYRGTLCWLPNFAYNFCATRIRDRELVGVDLSSLRAVINCSEPVYHNSHELFATRFASVGFRREMLASCYAMAENTFAVSQSQIGVPPLRNPSGGIGNAGQVSSGRLLPNVALRVLDEHRRDLPEGVIGELAIRSNCMLSEYYHRPDATAQAFHEGFYLTGDLGYVWRGEVFVTGRKKDLIIVGGKNVYPQDLEQLASEVVGVRPGRVAAFGVFNEESGTEDVVIVAESDAVTGDARERLAEAVRAHITRNSDVAAHRVVIVEPHWLIKTSSGKVARSANREKYLALLRTGELTD